jgi:hypothetical protein
MCPTSSCTRNRVPGSAHQAGTRYRRAPRQRLRMGEVSLLPIHPSAIDSALLGRRRQTRRCLSGRVQSDLLPAVNPFPFPHTYTYTLLYVLTSHQLGAHAHRHRHVLALPSAIQTRLVVPRRRHPAPRHNLILPLSTDAGTGTGTGGGELLLLNTHLDHVSDAQRRLGAAMLLHRARHEAHAKPGILIFVTGDFNRCVRGASSLPFVQLMRVTARRKETTRARMPS